ncbi:MULTISPECIES: sulfite exporter TauE/SafE family protein [Arthrobacter]|uniref:Probable membrane transporter protein n=2 Tax=Arthrobacter TaxID=1663 RepID=A0ABU9KG76_9MICC|nr:sulfite exporter TauE/SafE family protein [Arthrobacter sp. YJM1]MDP5225818.1 sulfite exporter TauE/SafE family protein [Arthrobacter sp. YJM1]
MEWLHGVLIFIAGLWAGTINAVVGSGTLVTFPVLVALGTAPVTASISNATGLIAGGFSSAIAYRKQLDGHWRTLGRLLPASVLGGITGAYLLLHLPESVFQYVAPVLIVAALLLVVFQPKLQAWVRNREQVPGNALKDKSHGTLLVVLVFLAGVYGGYFVAAQGVLLVGILGVFMAGTMQQANAMKNFLVLAVNLVAAASYLLFAFGRIDWSIVLIIAVSSLIGGVVGAKVGQKLKPVVLRSVIVVLGLVALAVMVSKLLA